MSDLQLVRLMLKGALSELPEEEKAKLDSAMAKLKACLESEPKELRAVLATLLFVDYGKELGL